MRPRSDFQKWKEDPVDTPCGNAEASMRETATHVAQLLPGTGGSGQGDRRGGVTGGAGDRRGWRSGPGVAHPPCVITPKILFDILKSITQYFDSFS